MSPAPLRPLVPAVSARGPVLVSAARAFALPPALEAALLAGLPATRRARLAGLADAAARHRSLLGSHLLRRSLWSLGHGPQALASLRYPPSGKPTLDLPVDFSLSHGGEMVVCAVSRAGPVGVDVEATASLAGSEFRLYLSEEERAWAGSDAARFLAVWTCKEAVVKAAGEQGLKALPRVATRDGGCSAIFEGRLWRAAPLPLDGAHVARLAWPAERGEIELHCTVLTREALQAGPVEP